MKPLVVANYAVLIAVALHDLDHLRQAMNAHYTIPHYLLLVNVVAYAPNVLALLLMRFRRVARLLTIAGCALIIVSFSRVHLLGGGSFWGLWATRYPTMHVDALTWFMFALPIVAAVAAIGVALRER